jgi:hypothetical protein
VPGLGTDLPGPLTGLRLVHLSLAG